MAGTFGPWGKALSALASFPKDVKEAKRKALMKEAQFFRGEIVKGIREQAPGGKAFRPLSEHTIAMRKFLGFKGTKALMKRGDLRNSIAVQELHDSDDSLFVGVLRTSKGEQGQPLVDVARLQEEGSKPIIVKITPKMAALLHMAFRKAGGKLNRMGPAPIGTGIIVVQIPARPFITPVFEKFGKPEEASKRFAERVEKEMKGSGVWERVKG